jgi:predicted MFS family arabinose efflux permease
MGWNQAFTYVAATALLYQLALGLQRVVYNNFIAEELGFDARQMGLIESVRELPGLGTIILAAVTVMFARSVVAGICILASAAGLLLYAQSTSLATMLLGTLVLSSGFHLFDPVQSAQVLQGVPPGAKAQRLGELNSIGAVSSLVAMGFVFLTATVLSFRDYFMIAAGVAALASLVIFSRPRVRVTGPRRNFVFRRRYLNYYALSLLSGARRHVYMTFATFCLVTVYGQSVRAMSLLMVIASVLAIFTRPAFGRIIDRLGERRVLMMNYTGVAALSLGYAFVPYVWAIYAIFIADSVLQGFEVAHTTYIDKIAPAEDIPPTLAMGITINHITGVAVPAAGGLLWVTFGFATTFVAGAAVALMAAYFGWRINLARETVRARGA